MLRWLLAAVHLLGLGVGLGSVWARARLLGGAPLDAVTLRRALTADVWWGIAALLWIGSGLWRLFAATEEDHRVLSRQSRLLDQDGAAGGDPAARGASDRSLSAWRRRVARNETPDLRAAAGIARTSYVQVVLVILMVLTATAMARGMG